MDGWTDGRTVGRRCALGRVGREEGDGGTARGDGGIWEGLGLTQAGLYRYMSNYNDREEVAGVLVWYAKMGWQLRHRVNVVHKEAEGVLIEDGGQRARGVIGKGEVESSTEEVLKWYEEQVRRLKEGGYEGDVNVHVAAERALEQDGGEKASEAVSKEFWYGVKQGN